MLLYLTIAAAIAEEDLNRYGQNVAWTIQDRFEKGDISVVGIRMLGYETRNKKLHIIPSEAAVVQQMFELYSTGNYSKRFGEINSETEQQLKKLINDENELIALHVKGLISKIDLENERVELRKQRIILERQINEYRQSHIKNLELKPITEFNEELVGRVLKQVTIQDWIITFEFYNGIKISRQYTNGPSGNQKGWKEKKRLKEAQE